MITPRRVRGPISLLRLSTAIVLLAVGCSKGSPPAPEAQPTTGVSATPLGAPPTGPSTGVPLPLGAAGTTRRPLIAPIIVIGTGRLINDSIPGGATAGVQATPGGVTLAFVNAEIRDVVRSVFVEHLRQSFVIDPAVQGTMTLQTSEAISPDAVLPMLESALQLHGFALVRRDGVTRVVPSASAQRLAALSITPGQGYVTRIVQPQFVSAADLHRALEPLAPPGAAIRVDAGRNILLVSGPTATVEDILNNVAVFDADYMRGMSFAVLPVRNTRSRSIAAELTTLIANTAGPAASLVKVASLDRLNAVLVTSQQPRYLEQVRSWVTRLDQGADNVDQQLFVYQVQNGRATDLAAVLRRALGLPGATGDTTASGASASRIPADDSQGFATGGRVQGGGQGQGGVQGFGAQQPTLPQVPAIPVVPQPQADAGGSPAYPESSGVSVRITADEINNALVIFATPQQYALLEAALQKLDIVPLQVLIEATIAEVTLTNELAFGLQYYLKAGNFQAFLGQRAPASSSTPFQGFNFIPGADFLFSTLGGSSIILSMLDQVAEVRVLSSPNLLVLNNQPARLQVGDQVPIVSQSAVGVLSPGAPIVNSIEYRDTGVILRVTPRVNASGMILLDVSQEVSNVSATTSSTINSPTISQRRINTTVAVADGQTLGLGGLISDNSSLSRDGIPLLQDIPVLGALFGTRGNRARRTELLVLLTPRIVYNREGGQAVTEELRRKLPLTRDVVTPRSR